MHTAGFWSLSSSFLLPQGPAPALGSSSSAGRLQVCVQGWLGQGTEEAIRTPTVKRRRGKEPGLMEGLPWI